jgi:conjugal transfer pilus assembly protein TraW
VRIRFFKVLAFLLGTLAAAPSYGGGADFLGRSDSILEQAGKSPVPVWLSRPPAQLDPAFADRLGRDGLGRAGAEAPPKRLSRETGRWVFVSFSMPEKELGEALEYAAESKAVAVFRGIEPGGDLGVFIKRVRHLGKGLAAVPSAIIDPYLFKQYGVDAVPALAVGEGEGKAKTVAGLLSFDWLDKQAFGRHGMRGQSYPVAEPDLVEEMQRRMASVDWDAQKAKAFQGYWQRHGDFLDLPETKTEAVRRFDPGVRVTQDIKLPNGNVLARAGEVFNPQQIMPLSKAIVFFDATRPGQAAKALAVGKAFEARGKPVVYLVSRIDAGRGWDHLKALYATFNGPVYLLSKAVAERFHVERLPSVLEGEGDRLAIREVLPTPATGE